MGVTGFQNEQMKRVVRGLSATHRRAILEHKLDNYDRAGWYE